MTFLRMLKGAAAPCSLLTPFPLGVLTPFAHHLLAKGQMQHCWVCGMDRRGSSQGCSWVLGILSHLRRLEEP